MTLVLYTPEQIDGLALRFFDLAATLRNMSTSCREHGLDQLPMHDRKPLEFLVRLEEWAHKAQAAQILECQRHRGARRASEAVAQPQIAAGTQRPKRAKK